MGTCSCYNDNRCYNTCDKCYQGYNNYNTGGFSGNSGGSSNFGSSNSNFGSSNSNYGNSNSGSGYTNCNSCSCTYSSSCRRSCYKCNNSGGWREMGLTAPIQGKHLHLPPLPIIMAVVLLTLVMPKIFEFAFIIFLVQNISAKIL